MNKLRDAAQKALEALETVLSDAYHRRFLECCGRPGIECCGNPNEAWTPEDNKIMDLLSPAQRQLSEALCTSLAEQPVEQEPVAWGLPRPDGLILDVICPEEHEREPGQYTVPLYAAPQPAKREPDVDQLRCHALQDLSYIHGVKAGWNAGIDQNQEKYLALTRGQQDALRVLKSTTEAPQPVKQPLTEAEITVMAAKAGFTPTLIVTDGGAFLRLARAIEAAHGITGEQK